MSLPRRHGPPNTAENRYAPSDEELLFTLNIESSGSVIDVVAGLPHLRIRDSGQVRDIGDHAPTLRKMEHRADFVDGDPSGGNRMAGSLHMRPNRVEDGLIEFIHAMICDEYPEAFPATVFVLDGARVELTRDGVLDARSQNSFTVGACVRPVRRYRRFRASMSPLSFQSASWASDFVFAVAVICF
ncbi:MAG: hypothetical protein V3V08_15310 [Nannocystaceae bacterium]